jgi:hypothetical protein
MGGVLSSPVSPSPPTPAPPPSPARRRGFDGWAASATVPLVVAAVLHVAGLFLGQGGGLGPMSHSAQSVVAEVVLAGGWLLAAGLAAPARTRPAGAAVAAGLALGELGLVVSELLGLGTTPGPGYVVVAAGWLVGAIGAAVAVLGSPLHLGRPSRHQPPALLAPLAAVAAIVMAVALLPAWDHYVLYIHAVGQSRSLDEGSAFAASTPTGALVGDLMAAVAWVAVPVAGVLWRPGRIGVLAGAGVLVAVASQVTSAVVGFDAPGTLRTLVTPQEIQRYGVVLQSSSLTGWYDVEVLAALVLTMLLMVRWWAPDGPGASAAWTPPGAGMGAPWTLAAPWAFPGPSSGPWPSPGPAPWPSTQAGPRPTHTPATQPEAAAGEPPWAWAPPGRGAPPPP